MSKFVQSVCSTLPESECNPVMVFGHGPRYYDLEQSLGPFGKIRDLLTGQERVRCGRKGVWSTRKARCAAQNGS